MLAPIGFNSVIFSLHPSSFIVNPLNYTTMNLLWAHHTLLLSRMCPSLSSGSCGSATQASCRTVPQPLTVSSSSLFLHCSSNPRGSRAPLLYSLSLSSCSLQASGSLDGQAFSKNKDKRKEEMGKRRKERRDGGGREERKKDEKEVREKKEEG